MKLKEIHSIPESELRKILITPDGKGVEAKSEALQELLSREYSKAWQLASDNIDAADLGILKNKKEI